MRLVATILAICTLSLPFTAATAAEVFDQELTIDVRHGLLGRTTKIAVGSFHARPDDAGTVVYLHGYADRFNNHRDLLTELHKGGLRVLAFDYPGHGLSEGSIKSWDTEDVAALIKEVLNHPRFREGRLAIDRRRPLILVGWSTGGTLALRSAQTWMNRVLPEDLRLAGVVAFAPAIGFKPTVGENFSETWGVQVLAKDLTRGKMPYAPRPTYTLASGKFVVTLASSSIAANALGAPQIPVLILAADADKDFFADVTTTINWIKKNRSTPTYGFQCIGSYHGVEFEPGGIGAWTRAMAVEFAQRLSQPDPRRALSDIERAYRNRDSRICPAVHETTINTTR